MEKRVSLTRAFAVALAAMAMTASVAATTAAAAPAKSKTPAVTIRLTEGGIPRILADSWKGLGFGYGYSLARENICSMAQIYTTVRGERSMYFGPSETWDFTGNGRTFTNLQGDFYFRRVIEEKRVEKLLARPVPNGPRPAIKQAVNGYVQGYNRYLAKAGVDNLSDPTCRGEEWVKPITKLDAYRRFFMLGILAGEGTSINGITDAQPPGTPLAARQAARAITNPTEADAAKLAQTRPDVGSNAIALGRESTSTGKGMLLGNPHFPWVGSERFYQSQLTYPGKMNASGASLLGVPVILIGHSKKLAWSHTVSTAFRFQPFQETLVPGDPTSYLVDGQPRKMESTTVTVPVRDPDGSMRNVTRTLYSTIHGPVTNSLQGQNLFAWTDANAYAIQDVNSASFRFINHFFDASRAQSVKGMVRTLRAIQGVPWVNTIAADSKGNAMYADIGAVPNNDDAKTAACNTPLGQVTLGAAGISVLDGSRSTCDLQQAEGAVDKGVLAPGSMPLLQRLDYTLNANDSYWLSNPEQLLEGFPRVIGTERTVRSLRTRLGFKMIQQRLDGTDGRKGRKFTRAQLQATVFNNRVESAELTRDALVAYCRANPVLVGSDGPVNVAEACEILAAWDTTFNLDSPGAPLWRRFANRGISNSGSMWQVPFDPANPVYTPNTLNTADPGVGRALANAVTDLQGVGIPLNATLRQTQFVTRNGERIGVHGGPGGVGAFNAISTGFNASRGFSEPSSGSSFVMAASMTGESCPDVKTILTYSQAATNPGSASYDDQTRLFSEKKWLTDRFCRGQQLASPGLRITKFAGGAKPRRGF